MAYIHCYFTESAITVMKNNVLVLLYFCKEKHHRSNSKKTDFTAMNFLESAIEMDLANWSQHVLETKSTNKWGEESTCVEPFSAKSTTQQHCENNKSEMRMEELELLLFLNPRVQNTNNLQD